eukprot:Opistho-2@79378
MTGGPPCPIPQPTTPTKPPATSCDSSRCSMPAVPTPSRATQRARCAWTGSASTSATVTCTRARSWVAISPCRACTRADAPADADAARGRGPRSGNEHGAPLDPAVVQVEQRLVGVLQLVLARRQVHPPAIGQRHQLDQFRIGADQVADDAPHVLCVD